MQCLQWLALSKLLQLTTILVCLDLNKTKQVVRLEQIAQEKKQVMLALFAYLIIRFLSLFFQSKQCFSLTTK